MTQNATIDCITKEAKLTINKTMCDQIFKPSTDTELESQVNGLRSEQKNKTLPLNVTGYLMCNITFDNTTGLVSK